ncbi:MAG: GNAT family N-acetyltransferase [Kofleriaceae bacterium]|nr:GNAT family N-acetyltransferase [Kofleriaceae bacterium]
MADWLLSTDPARLDLDRIHGWLSTAYWSPGVRREIVERAFANSLAIGAYAPDGEQLAVARVVTDRATFAWLCDVFVAPHARGQGIARAMVNSLVADPELTTLRRWMLGTRDAHGVYAACGFAPVDPRIFMDHKPDPARWSNQG